MINPSQPVFSGNFRSNGDADLRTSIGILSKARDNMITLDKSMRAALGIANDKKRGLMVKVIDLLVPKKLYEVLPVNLTQVIAEESDVLELIETRMKSNINDTQIAMRNLALNAFAKKEDLINLSADIKRARDEDWSATDLQSYMANRAGIEIYDEVSKLLDHEFSVITDEEREDRKNELLSQLEANVVIGEELVSTMGRTCSAGLRIFHRAIGQYFDYINVIRPAQVIRNAAIAITGTNDSIYQSREAIEHTMRASIEAISSALNASNFVEKYAIASPALQKLLQDCRRQLENSSNLLPTKTKETGHAQLLTH